MKKRILALLLALLMLASIMPFQIFAEGEPEPPVAEETSMPVTDPPCGTCGKYECSSDHLNWCAYCMVDDCGKKHCPTCGTIDCTADHGAPAAETSEEPEVHPLVGKMVKTTTFSFGFAYEAIGGNSYIVTNEHYPERMVVKAVETSGSTTYYQLFAAEGCAWPEDSNAKDGYWLDSAKLVVVTKCNSCGEYDCQKDHTQPTEPVQSTLTETYNDQTVTVSGMLPEGTKLKVTAAEGTEALEKFGISTDRMVFNLDITLMLNGKEYQPESAVKVKVPVNAAPGTEIGILHTHKGDTSFMCVTKVLPDDTVEFTTDRFSDWVGFVVDLSNTTVNFHIYLPGTWTQVSLAAALEANGLPVEIATDVTNVRCSDEDALHAVQSNGDWLLQAKKVFYDEKTFTLTFTDGTEAEIKAVGKPVYSVTFDCQGQTSDTPTIYFIPSEHAYYLDQYCQTPIADNKIQLPTKTGHVFEGFFAQPKSNDTNADRGTLYVDKNGYIQSACCGLGGSTTLYAHWQGIFTITYDLNYPDPPEFGPDTYTYDTPVVLPIPEREGYTFTYWKKETVDGNNWGSTWYKPTESPGIYSYGDVTLSARWEANPYTVAFDANGGSVDPTSMPVDYDSKYGTLPTPTRTGYDFTGWYTSAENETKVTAETVYKTAGDSTLYAHWSPTIYTISYDLADGTLAEGVTNPATYTIESNEIKLNNPTRTGYNFAGWTGTGLGAASTDVTIPAGSTGNREYTATWTPIEYKISYELNSGTLAEGVANTGTYTIESEDITLPTPTRGGYEFMGWSADANAESGNETVIKSGSTGDKTYYAKWAKLYTVSYMYTTNSPDGAPEPPATAQYKAGDTVTVSELPIVFDRYKVTAWYAYIDSNGATSVPIVDGKFKMPAADVRINGAWYTEITAKFVYNNNVVVGKIVSEIGSQTDETGSYTVGPMLGINDDVGKKITATPAANYKIVGVTVNNVVVEASEFNEHQYVYTVPDGGVTEPVNIVIHVIPIYDLTIKIDGTFSDQNYIFAIKNSQGNEVTRVVLHSGKNEVTVKKLPVGDYTVEPVSDWAWRGDVTGEKHITLSDDAIVTFNRGSDTKHQWLNGYGYGKGD